MLATTDSAPAGGAETAQVAGATGAAVLLTTALIVLGLGHRSGRIPLLGQIAAQSSRISGMPGWTALPSLIATIGLITAVIGLYWDVSLHIDNGRDPGPLANPSHYFILFGLFGIFTAGWLAIVLPESDKRPGPASIKVGPGWYAPASGLLMMACASFALLGFPLDDVFHRLFGQDVTLWGPTHLMMLGGAALTLVAILGLLAEGKLAGREHVATGDAGKVTGLGFVDRIVTDARVERFLRRTQSRRARLIAASGGLLIGLSIFQGEFDFGVPQFRLLFHPVLITIAAAIALVNARVIAGRGAAFAAVGFFLVVRGLLALLVGVGFDESTPHFPLFIAEALIVEAVALAVSAERPYRFGAAAGALIGSIGVLAEWGWSHVWMPHEWPGHIVPEAIALSVPVGIAGGLLGAFVGGGISLRRDVAGTRTAFVACTASLLVIIGVFGYLLRTSEPEGVTAAVTLTETKPSPGREAHATIRIDPPEAARDADWLSTIAWQGKQELQVEPLREVGDGVYRTASPVPIDGTWKTVIRLHKDDVIAGVPVFMPGDSAIPAREVPAEPRFERAFIADKEILQRERKDDVPAGLFATAAALVGLLTLALIGLLGFVLARIARAASPRPPAQKAAPAATPGAPVPGAA